MRTSVLGWRIVFFLSTIALSSWGATPSDAQGIRIQSGGPFGGFHLGINTGPSFGYGSRFGYGGIGYPGFGYGVGIPYSSYRYGYPDVYDLYRAQSMYRDYRLEYYDRLLGSSLYAVPRDLAYDYPRYRYSYGISADPLIASPHEFPAYVPPIVAVEPLLEHRRRMMTGPELSQEAPPENLNESLRASATRLSASLSRRRNDGEIWLDYLSPGKIIQAIDQGLPPESLRELMRSYDGIVGNPDLASVASADGFARTRQLLRQWIDSSSPMNAPASTSNAAPSTKATPRRAATAVPAFEDPASGESSLDATQPSEPSNADDSVEPSAKRPVVPPAPVPAPAVAPVRASV